MSDEEIPPQPQSPYPFDTYASPEMMAGAYANYALINFSPYEFTLDFLRVDFAKQPHDAVVVARVAMSPLLITQLIDVLNTSWQGYAAKSMPKEVTDGFQWGQAAPGPSGDAVPPAGEPGGDQAPPAEPGSPPADE